MFKTYFHFFISGSDAGINVTRVWNWWMFGDGWGCRSVSITLPLLAHQMHSGIPQKRSGNLYFPISISKFCQKVERRVFQFHFPRIASTYAEILQKLKITQTILPNLFFLFSEYFSKKPSSCSLYQTTAFPHQCNVSKEKHLKLHNIWLDNKKVSNESFVKIWRWCYI